MLNKKEKLLVALLVLAIAALAGLSVNLDKQVKENHKLSQTVSLTPFLDYLESDLYCYRK